MGSDKTDEDDAPVVVDFNNETEGVAFNVEDNAISGKYVGALVVFFNVLRPAPICCFGFMEPGFKRDLPRRGDSAPGCFAGALGFQKVVALERLLGRGFRPIQNRGHCGFASRIVRLGHSDIVERLRQEGQHICLLS